MGYLSCPLCDKNGLYDVQELQQRIASVLSRTLSCPICSATLQGLPSMHFHLAGHIPMQGVIFQASSSLPASPEQIPSLEKLAIRDEINSPKSGIENTDLQMLMPIVGDNSVPGCESLNESSGKSISYNCDLCGLIFSSSYFLNLHKDIMHSDINSFEVACKQCKSRFKNLEAYRDHVKEVHSDRRYICDHCPKSFKIKGGLLVHTRMFHDKSFPSTCNICKKNFTSKARKELHERRYHCIDDMNKESSTTMKTSNQIDNLEEAKYCLENLLQKTLPSPTSSLPQNSNLESPQNVTNILSPCFSTQAQIKHDSLQQVSTNQKRKSHQSISRQVSCPSIMLPDITQDKGRPTSKPAEVKADCCENLNGNFNTSPPNTLLNICNSPANTLTCLNKMTSSTKFSNNDINEVDMKSVSLQKSNRNGTHVITDSLQKELQTSFNINVGCTSLKYVSSSLPKYIENECQTSDLNQSSENRFVYKSTFPSLCPQPMSYSLPSEKLLSSIYNSYNPQKVILANPNQRNDITFNNSKEQENISVSMASENIMSLSTVNKHLDSAKSKIPSPNHFLNEITMSKVTFPSTSPSHQNTIRLPTEYTITLPSDMNSSHLNDINSLHKNNSLNGNAQKQANNLAATTEVKSADLNDFTEEEQKEDTKQENQDKLVKLYKKNIFSSRGYENKQWECEECRKTFTTKYFLKKHRRLHTGETPYSCEECGKTFTFQQSYHKHVFYHSDDKPHICPHCNRAFKEMSTLHNHIRIHTGEKPFVCITCGKAFRQRVSYLVHQRIHTGQMPYRCDVCSRAFRYKVSLRSHKCEGRNPGESSGSLIPCNETTNVIEDSSSSSSLHKSANLKNTLILNEKNSDSTEGRENLSTNVIPPNEFRSFPTSPDNKISSLLGSSVTMLPPFIPPLNPMDTTEVASSQHNSYPNPINVVNLNNPRNAKSKPKTDNNHYHNPSHFTEDSIVILNCNMDNSPMNTAKELSSKLICHSNDDLQNVFQQIHSKVETDERNLVNINDINPSSHAKKQNPPELLNTNLNAEFSPLHIDEDIDNDVFLKSLFN